MKERRRSFYFKLLSIIMILSTFPIIIVGLFSYLKSSEMIQLNITKEKEQSVYQIQENFEQILKMVDVSVTNFVTSYQLISTLKEPLVPKQFQLYNQIKKEMAQIQQFDSGMSDLLLISLNQKWGINNRGLKRLDQSLIDEMVDHYFTSPYKSYWLLENKEDLYLDSAGAMCDYYISLVKLIPLVTTEKDGLAIAYIPVCNFFDILQNANAEITIVLDSNYNVIGHSHSDQIGKSYRSQPFLQEIVSGIEEEGQFNFTWDDSDYRVIYRKSPYNNWTYVSMVQLTELYKQSRSIGWFTFLICSIIIIGILIFAFLSSRRLYAPINHLTSIVENTLAPDNHIHAKNKDEFSIIERQINYMLEQNEELELKLQGQINQLKQFFVTRLLQGKVEKEEIPDKLDTYNYNQTWNQFVVMAIQIDEFESKSRPVNHEDLLLFTINTMIEEIIPENERLTPIVLDKTQVTLYLTKEKKYSKHIHLLTEMAEAVQNRVEQELDVSISIGYSKLYTDLIDAATAYKESKEALRYTLKYGAGSIIFFEDLQRDSSFYTSYPRQIENLLFDAIKLGNKEEVDKYLDEMIQSLFDEQLNHTQYELSIVRFLTNLIELSETLGVNVLEFEEHKSLFDQLYEFKTLTEVVDWFKNTIIYPVMNKVEERSKSQYKSISDEIIHIIQEEFESDITLNYVADKLHYNPNYLSSIFRKETNTSFSEYLTHVRINKAKEWLTETNMTVKEIAERLNYNNSQNFIRSFKKIEGITPGRYRKEKGNPS